VRRTFEGLPGGLRDPRPADEPDVLELMVVVARRADVEQHRHRVEALAGQAGAGDATQPSVTRWPSVTKGLATAAASRTRTGKPRTESIASARAAVQPLCPPPHAGKAEAMTATSSAKRAQPQRRDFLAGSFGPARPTRHPDRSRDFVVKVGLMEPVAVQAVGPRSMTVSWTPG
jgi:hypothetical protein